MKKQELINQTYQALGMTQEFIDNNVTTNGWCETRKKCDFASIQLVTQIEYQSQSTYYWRPIALHNLEDNNGWKIVTDSNKLKNFQHTIETYVDGEIKRGYDVNATHWRLANNKRPLFDE